MKLNRLHQASGQRSGPAILYLINQIGGKMRPFDIIRPLRSPSARQPIYRRRRSYFLPRDCRLLYQARCLCCQQKVPAVAEVSDCHGFLGR